MTSISRNGVSGLIVQVTTIALAAILFGCSPRLAPVEAASAQPASDVAALH